MEFIAFEKKIFEEISMKLEHFFLVTDLFCKKVERRKLGRWLDHGEVCRALNISHRTLQTLRDNGILAFTKLGNRTYYLEEDVQRIVPIVKSRRERIGNKGRDI